MTSGETSVEKRSGERICGSCVEVVVVVIGVGKGEEMEYLLMKFRTYIKVTKTKIS